MHAQHAYTQACILPSKSVAKGGKSERSLAEPSHRRSQSIWQPCSVAVALQLLGDASSVAGSDDSHAL